MAFGREIEGFAQSFIQGYNTIRSPEEREAERVRTEYNKGQLELQKEQLTPEARERRRKKAEQDFQLGEQTLLTGAEDLSAKRYENTPEVRAAKEAANRADLAWKEADTKIKQAATDPQNLKLAREAQEAEKEWRRSETEKNRILNEANNMELGLKKTMMDILTGGDGSQPLAPGTSPRSTTPAPSAVPAEEGGSPLFPNLSTPEQAKENLVIQPPGPQSAVDTGDGSMLLGYSGNDQPTGDEGLPGVRMNRGMFAIEDMRRGIDPNLRDQQPEGESTFIDPKDRKVIHQKALDAGKEGLNHLMQISGLHEDYAVGTPDTDQRAEDFLTGVNAGPADTVEMLYDTMGEAEPELSQNERIMKALALGYNYYNSIGEPEKAQNYAAGLMGHNMKMAGQFAAFAKAAASGGDPDGAAEALMRAYDYIPNGDILKITPALDGQRYTAQIKDAKGKVKYHTVMTPEELGAAAMNIDPSMFTTIMSRAAGIKDETMSPAAAEILHEIMPEVSAEKWNAMTTTEANTVMSTMGSRQKMDDAVAEEDRKNRITDMDKLMEAHEGITTATQTRMDKAAEDGVENVYGEPGTDFSPAETKDLMAAGKVPDYRDEVERTALDMFSRRNNNIVNTNEAVQFAENIALEEMETKKVNDRDIAVWMGEGTGWVTINRERYNALNTVRKMRDEIKAIEEKTVEDREKASNEATKRLNDDIKRINRQKEDRKRRESQRGERRNVPSLIPNPERAPMAGGAVPTEMAPARAPSSVNDAAAEEARSQRLARDLQQIIPGIGLGPVGADIVTPAEAVPVEPRGRGMSIRVNPNPAPRAPFIQPNPEDYPFPRNPF